MSPAQLELSAGAVSRIYPAQGRFSSGLCWTLLDAISLILLHVCCTRGRLVLFLRALRRHASQPRGSGSKQPSRTPGEVGSVAARPPIWSALPSVRPREVPPAGAVEIHDVEICMAFFPTPWCATGNNPLPVRSERTREPLLLAAAMCDPVEAFPVGVHQRNVSPSFRSLLGAEGDPASVRGPVGLCGVNPPRCHAPRSRPVQANDEDGVLASLMVTTFERQLPAARSHRGGEVLKSVRRRAGRAPMSDPSSVGAIRPHDVDGDEIGGTSPTLLTLEGEALSTRQPRGVTIATSLP